MTKETKAIFKKLNRENRKIIERIDVYLGTRYLNEVCYSELLADIIGMAYESQERGERFSDTVGMNIGTFCEELAENTPKQTMTERLFGILAWTMAGICILMPMLWGYAMLFPKYSPMEAQGISFTVPLAYLIKYAAIVLIFALGRNYIRCGTYRVHTAYVMALTVAFIAVLIISDNLIPMIIGLIPISINLIVWVIAFASLTLLCLLARKLIILNIAYSKKNKSDK